MGGLVGPDPELYPVSETVFEWIEQLAEDSCGLTVNFFDQIVTEDNFVVFNHAAMDRNAFAMLIGSYHIEDDSVLLYLIPEQIYTSPSLLVDREYFSRPEEPMVFSTELLGSLSDPPGFIRFYVFLLSAFAHSLQNQNHTALAEIDCALRCGPGIPPEALAEAYLFRSQMVSMTSSDYGAGIPYLDTALEIDPGCIRARLARGYMYELAGDFQSALDQYTMAIETEPALYKSYKVRANLLSRNGMYEESIADYTTAVRLNPDDFESWHYGGVDLRRSRNFQAGFEWLTRALELEPETAQVWYDRALVNAISEIDLEMAIEDLSRAIELDGTHWKWYDIAATIWIVRDQWEECIEAATLGLDISPREPQLLLTRSTGYMMLEDIESALVDFETALEEGIRRNISFREDTYTIQETLRALSQMVPNSAQYLLYLGYAYGEGGYYEEAVEQLTRAVLINPSLKDAYWLRGINLIETGHAEQAVQDLQKALELTDDPTERESIRQFIEQLGE